MKITSSEIGIAAALIAAGAMATLAVKAETRQATQNSVGCIEASMGRLAGLTDVILDAGTKNGYGFDPDYAQDVATDLQAELHREGEILEQWHTISIGVTQDGQPLVAKVGPCTETMPSLSTNSLVQ